MEHEKRRLESLDRRIVALFEQRMAIAEQAAENLSRRQLKRQARRVRNEASDKATRFACDVTTIVYTEEVLRLMQCAYCKYQRKLIRRGKEKLKIKPC